MTVPARLPEQMTDLYRRIAEIERRFQNRRRTGKVDEVDYQKKVARVDLGPDADGEPFLTPWIPWKTLTAGTSELNVPPSKGQQVDVVSENGDLAEAVIESSSKSTDHPLPDAGEGEWHYKSGDVEIHYTKDKITLKAKTIVLVGDIELGAEGASRELALQGTVDDAGHANVGNLSTKVKAV